MDFDLCTTGYSSLLDRVMLFASLIVADRSVRVCRFPFNTIHSGEKNAAMGGLTIVVKSAPLLRQFQSHEETTQ